MSYYPEFSKLLENWLSSQDRNASWLAKRLGVSASTVMRWRQGSARPQSPEMVGRIADILNIYRQEDRQLLLQSAGYGYVESPPNKENTDSVPTEENRERFPLGVRSVSTPPFMVPPLPPQGVLGRNENLVELIELMALNEATEANIPPMAISGMGGIGKTTLAIALARNEAVTRFFPDGVLWASVGIKRPNLRRLLDDWGRALGIDLVAERDEQACSDRLRAVLHHRRVFLVVDDVWEVSHGNYFRVAGPQCRLIFTTRELPVAYTLATKERTRPVGVMQPETAIDLLFRLAPDAVQADLQNTKRLCDRLEYLPLALTLAGRLLANESNVPSHMQRLLSELLERGAARLQLLQEEGRPDLSQDQPVSLQSILGMSVERLSRTDQERFALLAVFGGEPLVWEAQPAAHVWHCSIEEAEASISRFVQRGLVMRRGTSYWMHALLADYATEMMEKMSL